MYKQSNWAARTDSLTFRIEVFCKEFEQHNPRVFQVKERRTAPRFCLGNGGDTDVHDQGIHQRYVVRFGSVFSGTRQKEAIFECQGEG